MSTVSDDLKVDPGPKPTVTYREGWLDNIPAALKEARQWVVWQYELVNGRWTKVLYNPDSPGRKAKSNDPRTWNTIERALATWRREPDVFDGIGFVFSINDGFCGIDFDNCIGPDGEIADWAKPHIEALRTAWGDVSPSGRGIKFIVRAVLPGTGTRRGGFGPDGKGAIEVYDRLRFFTICGNPFGDSLEIIDGQDVVDPLYGGLKARPKPSKNPRTRVEDVRPVTADDAVLLRKARNAKGGSGEKFSALYDRADISGHPSASEAEAALCARLAWWTQRDAERMDKLLLASALGQRDKVRERPDYRARTIAFAIENCHTVYEPRPKAKASRAAGGSANGKPPGGAAEVGEATPEVFQNFRIVQLDDDGEKFGREPIDQTDLIQRLAELTDGGPQLAGAALFAHDGGDAEPIQFSGPDQLFAWVGQRFPIDWQGGGAYVSERRLFEGLKFAVRRYDSIERRPHFPTLPGVYYACTWPDTLGDGAALDGLLDLFSPATDHDRELIRSFVYTLFWGGEPGKRPVFLAEGPDGDPMGGRGVGKSDLFSYLAELVGGAVSNISARDDISTITKRIINDRARKRVVLLDNVKAERFSWGDFEGLITGPTVGGWLNYIGDESRPNLLTYCVTINGASLSEDLAQRTVMIRLDRPESYDRDGQAWSDHAMGYIRENRAAIVADVAAAFAKPAAPIKSYQRWASWTHAVLARCAEPIALQNTIIKRQDGINDDRAASNDFGRLLARKIHAKTGRDAADVVIWISTDALVPLVREFTEDRVGLLNVSKKINRFRPSELTKSDRTAARGWKWAGRNTDPKAAPSEEWIHPWDGSDLI